MIFRNKFLLIFLIFSALLISSESFSAQEKKEIRVESIEAENISNDKNGNLVMEGGVVINTNLLSFQSSKAIFNESEGLLELKGNVEVSSNNVKVNSSEIKANFNLQNFYVKSAQINKNDSIFSSADEFTIKTSGDVELINTSVTSCSKIDPVWVISTKSVTYLKDKRNAIIKGIKLKIKNTPVFYIPFVRTSLGSERMTGFLTPGLHQTNNGLDISLPYYFNLAPNYDLVLTPKYITSRGPGFSSNFRYLNKKFEGDLNMTGLSSDNTYKRETGQSNSRWYLSWENKVFFNDNLYSNINLQTSSDEYFFRDIGNNQFGQTKTSYLPKKFGLTWKNSYFKIDLDLIRYQILNPFSFQEYKSKPSLTIQSFLSKKDLHLSLFINKSKFKLDTINPMRETYKKVDRTYFSPQLTYKKHLPSSSFLVTTGTTYIKHDLDSKEESQSSPWVEMKYSFFLDKDTKTTFKSLIPVLKYIYVKNNSKKQTNLIDSRTISLDYSTIFQRDRFEGLDRFSKENKIILGVEQVSIKQKDNSYKSLSIGQVFYLDKRISYENPENIMSRSPIVAEFKAQLNGKFWSTSLVEWDSGSNKTNLATIGLSYQENEQKRIELRSVYRRQDPNKIYIPWIDKKSKTNHTELITQWPLLKSVNIFMKLQRDYEEKKSNDILFGFEYSNCCLKWGLMHRKWVEEDYFSWQKSYLTPFEALSKGFDPSIERDKTYIFFELKDIGRLGKKISKALSSSKLE